MGADGTLYLMKAETFAERWPGLVPQSCGLKEHTILGIPALTAYTDTSGIDDFEYSVASKWHLLQNQRSVLRDIEERGEGEPGKRSIRYGLHSWSVVRHEADVRADIARMEADPEIGEAERCAQAIDWFEQHAESITVWT